MVETMGNLKRTHYCGELREKNIGQEVVVAGFVDRQRELGNLTFVVLRDYSGLIQLAFNEQTNKEMFLKAKNVRSEFVVIAKGKVIERVSKNPNLPTGDVEIQVTELRVLSKSKVPPFEIKDNINVNEELGLSYRFLDLRRKNLQSKIIKRHEIAKATRDFFSNNKFFEIETPILIKSTPEGARDYLVPSRVHPGSFYCLPQSPQTIKQMLMVSGFDRYFQLAKCFRDEDLRADRQPEFTQIDVEMSYVDEEDIYEMGENFMKHIFKEVLDLEIKTPFFRQTYHDAMENYGSDKPDLRFEMKLHDLSEGLLNTEFGVFSTPIKNGGAVKGINAKGLAQVLSRKALDRLVEFIKDYGAKGLAYTRLNTEEGSSSYEKFLSSDEVKTIREKLDGKTGDVILIVADTDIDVVYAALGALRVHIAKEYDQINKEEFNFSWVTDFPLMEKNKETGKLSAAHHPFTSPNINHLEYLETDPLKATARAYDMIVNGFEAGGGSIRINDLDLQRKMFEVLGMSQEESDDQFGFLLKSFEYGVPPHGGIAWGLDRITMIMTGTDNIKDVIAFPKTQNARDLLMGAPAPVAPLQLEELNIILAKDKK